MADEQQPHEPEQQPPRKEESSAKKKISDLKSNPKVKSTQGMVVDYAAELVYLISMIIAGIYSIITYPRLGVGLIGAGFLIGLILYQPMNVVLNAIAEFIKKQEKITLVIISAVIIVLSFIIPYVMVGIMMGIPSGIGVRRAITDQKTPPPFND